MSPCRRDSSRTLESKSLLGLTSTMESTVTQTTGCKTTRHYQEFVDICKKSPFSGSKSPALEHLPDILEREPRRDLSGDPLRLRRRV